MYLSTFYYNYIYVKLGEDKINDSLIFTEQTNLFIFLEKTAVVEIR